MTSGNCLLEYHLFGFFFVFVFVCGNHQIVLKKDAEGGSLRFETITGLVVKQI